MNTRIIYEFEGYRLDTHTQVLQSPSDNGYISLKPKEFDVLLFFVQRAGELIDKETLMQGIWPDQCVEENNLNQYVTALRKKLGEERGGRRFIMNVRARGYRFVPEVLPLNHANNASESESSVPQNSAPTDNMVAWQCFQHAVFLRREDRPERWCEAIGLLERAVDLDPNFASAYAHLALTRISLLILDHPGSTEMLEQAEKESRLAVKLRPGIADGYMALGAIDAAYGRWVEAELNFLAARKLDDEWLMPINMHSINVLLSVGHLQRAIEISHIILRDVEGDTTFAILQAVACLLADRDEPGEQAMQLAIAMGAQTTQTPMADALTMIARRNGQFELAADTLIPSLSSYLMAAGCDTAVRQVFAAIENSALTDQAVDSINQFLAAVEVDKLPQSICRQVLLWFSELGALDEAYHFAFKVLDKFQKFNCVGTAWGSLWLKEMKPFRSDPRFTKFALCMHLPDYWKAFGAPDGHIWKDNRLLVLDR